MENKYRGRNSKTEYANVMVKKELSIVVYLMFGICLLLLLFIPSINQINKDNQYKIIFYIVAAFSGYLILNFLGFIIGYFVRIIRNIKLISFYKKNDLINVYETIIDYDYKLWQTAAINSYHPMSFKKALDNQVVKTAIIFTNHSHFGIFPKFKMPEVLRAKNYINNYALVGYDSKNCEWIIIEIVKKN